MVLRRLKTEAISNTSRGEAENTGTGDGPVAERAPPKASGAAQPTHWGSMEKSKAA